MSYLKSWLWLDNCKNIHLVPKLPQSINRIFANNCESLETSSKCKLDLLTLPNCGRLDGKTREKLISLAKSTIDEVNSGIRLVLPGSVIPKWFGYQSSESSIVTVTLPFNCKTVVGVTLSVVYECSSLTAKCSPICCRLKSYSRDDDASVTCEGLDAALLYSPQVLTSSDHLVLSHEPSQYVLNNCSQASFEFYSKTDDCVLKKCGVHLKFAEDFCGGSSSSDEEEYYGCNDVQDSCSGDEDYCSCNDMDDS